MWGMWVGLGFAFRVQGQGVGFGLGLGSEGGLLSTTSHSIFYSTGYAPTTFTRLVRCGNRVQYTSIGIQ